MHGSTRQVRYMATLRFEFPSRDLASADPASIEKTIETIVLPQSEVAAASTKTISLGQTPEQVKAILGEPEKIVNLGPKMYVHLLQRYEGDFPGQQGRRRAVRQGRASPVPRSVSQGLKPKDSTLVMELKLRPPQGHL